MIGVLQSIVVIMAYAGAVGVLVLTGVTTRVDESHILIVTHAKEQDVSLHSTIRDVSVSVGSQTHLEVLKY